ncbi:hypothetical protein [Megaira polyxenophila phage MAnkyphage_25.80]|nr:hypothetical protein [Megaira polyxenophila phage MAnkyphage_25.80]
MTYKKDIYDYVNKIDLKTVESFLTEYFISIANYATQDVWQMNIEHTIKTIRDYLNCIEDCLNGTLEEKDYTHLDGREFSNQALELRAQIIDLTEKYYNYINNREQNNE